MHEETNASTDLHQVKTSPSLSQKLLLIPGQDVNKYAIHKQYKTASLMVHWISVLPP